MIELIGLWSTGIHGDYEVLIDDGVMFVNRIYGRGAWGKRLDFKKAFGSRFFGDEGFLAGVDGDFVSKILFECDGKDLNGVYKVAEKYKGFREERVLKCVEEQKKWENLRETFNGYVIGIDKAIDVYGSGFSVRVVFLSDVSFREKAKFLRENRVEFVKWVMKEISESKKITNRIGSVEFYKPVEIVNLRAREAEVKFEVKEDIA